MRVIIKILQDHLSRCLLFIDDIGVKNPKIIYNNKKMAPDIRKYVLEHIQWLDEILADLERASYTISGAKSQEYGFRMGRKVSRGDNIIKTMFHGSTGTDFDKL